MIAQIIYVESVNVYVAILHNRIMQIQKCTDPHINPHAIRIDRFDVTTERTSVADNKLCLDATDLTTFAAWLSDQMPSASVKAFGNTMNDYFAGSMEFADILAAAGRIVCGPALKRPPQGEELYYIAKAKASDPEGFAAMAAAYAVSATPKVFQ